MLTFPPVSAFSNSVVAKPVRCYLYYNSCKTKRHFTLENTQQEDLKSYFDSVLNLPVLNLFFVLLKLRHYSMIVEKINNLIFTFPTNN